MATAKRARAGGERGVNGEWYEGGKFLPSTHAPKRAPASRRRGPRRAMVEPGVFAEVPDGKQAIYQQIRAFVMNDSVGDLHIMRHLDAPDSTCWDHYGPRDRVQALVDRYNAGERFVDLEVLA